MGRLILNLLTWLDRKLEERIKHNQHRPEDIKGVYYEHGFYGCETGCCGISTTIDYGCCEHYGRFDFGHSKEDADAHVKSVSESFGGAPIDWKRCDFESIKNCWEG